MPIIGALVRLLGARIRWVLVITLVVGGLAVLGLVAGLRTIEDQAASALNPVQRTFRSGR